MLVGDYWASFGSLADPAGSSVLVAAVTWLQETVLGTVATTVAIIAVAWVGLLMLMGRANFRYGLTVIAGCFILFGASSIVAGIQGSVASGSDRAFLAPPPEIPAPTLPPAPPAVNRDPYSGAAMPTQD